MQITRLQTLKKYVSLSENITYGHSYAQSTNVKKKNAKEYGRNMLLSWKTHFFEPSAHF